jgi:hypothetical protein
VVWGTSIRLRAVAATLAFACALLLGAVSASASTPHDLTGTWSCCAPGSGGVATQTWTITTMDKSSGAFSGSGKGGSYTWPITGNVNGTSVTLTTGPYNELPSYTAVFKGTISADSKTMNGDWDDNPGTPAPSGTWTATRPSAPVPGDPSAPKPKAPDPNLPGGTKTKAIPGDIYVVDSNANVAAGAIYKVNPENGQSTLVHVGPPLLGIRGVALGPEGNLFVTDIGAHAIFKIDLKTSAVTAVTAPLNPLLWAPWGIVYEPGLGEFLVTDALLGTVVGVDPKTGVVKTLAKEGGLATPHGIALEPGGAAYVTDFKSRAVIKVAQGPGGWKASTFKKGPFSAAEGIAIGTTAAGSRFYVADAVAPGGNNGITALSGVGGLFSWLGAAAPDLLYQPTTAGGVLLTPLGLAPSSDGKTLYIGSTGGLPGTGSLVAMNIADGKLRTVAGGFASPLAIAVAPPKQVEVKVSTSGPGTTATPNGVTTTVTSPQQPLVAVVSVSVGLPHGGFTARASKLVRVKTVSKPIPPGKRTKVTVPFASSLRKKIKAAQLAGKKVKAKVKVTVTAANGASRKAVRSVSLR